MIDRQHFFGNEKGYERFGYWLEVWELVVGGEYKKREHCKCSLFEKDYYN
jgi:hypothetical protein